MRTPALLAKLPVPGVHKCQFLHEYSLGGNVGKGRFTTVKVCTHKSSGKEYAVKIVDRRRLNHALKNELQVEVEVLDALRHPNVVQLHALYSSNRHYYLVMELLHGPDLFDHLVEAERLSEAEAKQVIVCAAKALSHCHANNVVHRGACVGRQRSFPAAAGGRPLAPLLTRSRLLQCSSQTSSPRTSGTYERATTHL